MKYEEIKQLVDKLFNSLQDDYLYYSDEKAIDKAKEKFISISVESNADMYVLSTKINSLFNQLIKSNYITIEDNNLKPFLKSHVMKEYSASGFADDRYVEYAIENIISSGVLDNYFEKQRIIIENPFDKPKVRFILDKVNTQEFVGIIKKELEDIELQHQEEAPPKVLLQTALTPTVANSLKNPVLKSRLERVKALTEHLSHNLTGKTFEINIITVSNKSDFSTEYLVVNSPVYKLYINPNNFVVLNGNKVVLNHALSADESEIDYLEKTVKNVVSKCLKSTYRHNPEINRDFKVLHHILVTGYNRRLKLSKQLENK